MARRPLLLVLLCALVAACSGGGDDAAAPSSTTVAPTSSSSTTTTAPPSTTTTLAPLPAAATDGPVRALVTPTGVVVAVTGGGPGAWRVSTPCDNAAVVPNGTPIHGATVVLDPGHGGVETGASGENGLVEKDLNLVVAEKARDRLEAQGATVVLTRTADYRITLQARAAIVQALQPPVFISVHHNGGHDGPLDKPGTETYYQRASAASKRLAGILYEELFRTFAQYDAEWHGNVDAGAKYRLNDEGGDYYGILRRTAGVAGVLSEALFLSAHPSEAALLADPAVQQAEADAIARAVRRFMLGDDPGSGFTEPIPRTTPAGPGGGGVDCVDPPLV